MTPDHDRPDSWRFPQSRIAGPAFGVIDQGQVGWRRVTEPVQRRNAGGPRQPRRGHCRRHIGSPLHRNGPGVLTHVDLASRRTGPRRLAPGRDHRQRFRRRDQRLVHGNGACADPTGRSRAERPPRSRSRPPAVRRPSRSRSWSQTAATRCRSARRANLSGRGGLRSLSGKASPPRRDSTDRVDACTDSIGGTRGLGVSRHC